MEINPKQIISTIQDRLNKKYPGAKIRVFRDISDTQKDDLRSLEIEHNIKNGSDKIYHYVNRLLLEKMPDIAAELIKRANPEEEYEEDGLPAWVFEINVFHYNADELEDFDDKYFHHIDECELANF